MKVILRTKDGLEIPWSFNVGPGDTIPLKIQRAFKIKNVDEWPWPQAHSDVRPTSRREYEFDGKYLADDPVYEETRTIE